MGALTVAALLVASPFGAPVAGGAKGAGSTGTIPVVDAFVIDIPVADGTQLARFEGAIHGAYRVQGGTVVYWSLREAGGSDVGLATALEYDDIDLIGGVLADPRSLDVLLPLGDGDDCLCTVRADVPEGVDSKRFQTMYTTFPPVPGSTTTIDVDVDGRGTVVADVPVDDRLPSGAQVEAGMTPLGTGWPAAPSPARLDGITAPEPQDLVGRSTSQEGAVITEGTGTDRLVRFESDVLFDFGQADLNADAREVMGSAVEALRAAGATRVEVIGHTDDIGTAQFNQGLSERRAQTVSDLLADRLGEDVELVVEGRGLHEPVATNETDEGRAMNRRVTISYSSEASR